MFYKNFATEPKLGVSIEKSEFFLVPVESAVDIANFYLAHRQDEVNESEFDEEDVAEDDDDIQMNGAGIDEEASEDDDRPEKSSKGDDDAKRGHSLHVVQNDDKDGWVVKTAEEHKILYESEDMNEAVEKGREMAKKNKVRLVIHSEHGKIQDQEDYGGHGEVRGQ